jgi:hypothetical protein
VVGRLDRLLAEVILKCRSLASLGIIDSLRPIEVDLARFRDTLGPAPSLLTGGAESFDALIRRFATAVEGRDSLALRRMQINAAEYAWLVYPSSPLTRPPYQQPPEIAWMLLRQPSDVGLTRLLKRRGGEPLGITSHACDPQPLVEGENKLWRRCTVQTATGGTERLFGMVVERRGQFKFLSYQNQY